MKISDYNAEVFNNLNPFHMAKTELAQKKEKIIEIGKILCENGINERVGICLLHNHFNLFDNELLVEQYINSNLIELSPRRDCFDQATYPYMWRVIRSDAGEFVWYPVEFTLIKGDYYLPNNNTLSLIAQSLYVLNLTDVFGISILHREFPPDENTLTLETTDLERRTLSIQVVSKEVLLDDDVSETLWKFFETDNYSISGACERHCYSHCVAHCRTHGSQEPSVPQYPLCHIPE